ncbi:hypothetical protein M378DRAFT_797923 [Amanita muscaria Koide BX008]|uniref:Nephrocystin 3-like N-terminal domain-containing protein n=1 Tax=Amanita muscaria (strain Koide BX008) TaxID=946122 RepID=A0A0C2WZE4_AMAMK|nr:hypothetical protein M378DRAFT_797923 [Amanita muscaria Koide BX008]
MIKATTREDLRVPHFTALHGLFSLIRFTGFVNFAQFVSFEALHDSSAQDFDRHVDQVIREKTLNQLQEWFDDPTVPAEQIIWLHGPASIGKTAIALEIARQEKVVATFFFNRSDPSRNDGNRLFPTLAWQLAVSIADVKTHITHVLNERPDLPKKRIEEQFEYLVAQPFAAMKKATSTQLPSCLVIVIDGIDECADIRLQRRILKVIEKAILGRRVPLQFIVFSRPDAHIQDIYNQFQCATRCIDLAKLGPAEEIKKRERYIRKREEELEEEECKLKVRVEEISKKEEEARKREEGVRLKEDEANVRELEVRRKEREMLQRAKEMEARRKELAVKYLEEEAGSSEEKAHRREEEIKMKQEELNRKEDEIMHLAEEMRQKAEEIKRQEEELMKRKEELERRELESRLEDERHQQARLQEDEMGRQKEDESKLKMKLEELKKKEDEVRQKEGEAEKKVEEASRKEGEAKRRQEEAQKLEEEARRKEEEAKRLVEVAEQREEEARRKQDEARLKMEEAKSKEEAAKELEAHINYNRHSPESTRPPLSRKASFNRSADDYDVSPSYEG